MTAPAALSPPHPPGTAAPHAAPVADAVATELATLLYKQSYGVLFANFAVALPVPVSYTHLDVYKRQRWRRSAKPATAARWPTA